MNIGVIGGGNIGGTLGKLWAAKGHQIMFGMREPTGEKAQALLASHGNIRVGSVAEAVALGEVVTVAVPWAAVEEVVSEGGDWTGKVVIDANNRFASVSESGASAAEDLARLAAGSRVVKAFNTIGFGRLGNPRFDSQTASMFICGDDQDAKSMVSALTAELGFDVVDVGSLANARLLESLAALWVELAGGGYGRDIAFKLLRD